MVIDAAKRRLVDPVVNGSARPREVVGENQAFVVLGREILDVIRNIDLRITPVRVPQGICCGRLSPMYVETGRGV